MIRLIGIDVDGTLLDREGHLPDENVAAIHQAVSAGIHVALVTGRSYPWARPVAEQLPESITLIVSNGAVERAKNGTTLARRMLSRTVASEILAATPASRHSAALIFDRDSAGQIVTETMDWQHPGRRAYFERNQALISRVAALEDALIDDPIQVMFNGGVADMRALLPHLQAVQHVAIAVAEYEERDFSLVDVTSVDATKGKALAWRAAALGLARDETMAVGDNFNDIEMLETVGLPVVMGNAVSVLRDRGWAVTGDQDEAGLAQAIRRFALR